MHMLARVGISAIVVSLLAGCASPSSEDISSSVAPEVSKVKIVTGSTVVASLVDDIAGDYSSVVSLVPNSVDAHTYEPLPSEMKALETADIVFMADEELNSGLTELVLNAVPSDVPVIFLNESVLQSDDYIYINRASLEGKNPHTWTNLRFTWYWVNTLEQSINQLLVNTADQAVVSANARALQKEINSLHEEILGEVSELPIASRKLVVYHDAWEYFGREYGITVVGTLQAFDYSEPSPAQLATIIQQIKINNVKSFYGSEVFPSDVLETISRETGAKYISDLSDDALPAEVGARPYLYVELMKNNLELILEGLM